METDIRLKSKYLFGNKTVHTIKFPEFTSDQLKKLRYNPDRGLKIDKDSQLIITGFDNDDYYGEGYSFHRSKVNKINVSNHTYAEFGWGNDLFLITFEYEFGLFKQYLIRLVF